jgi:type VI secretion system ImpA family protein
MASRVYLSEELLQPVRPEQPAGDDLRFERVFAEILEARRADDSGAKSAQWEIVADRCLGALPVSKDLRLCCLLTEAAIQLDGFAGLRDCLRLTRELVVRFWDQGLYPLIEVGDHEYRASSLSWFNDRMPDAIRLVPITARESGDNYNFSRFLQAQEWGTEESVQRMTGAKREAVPGLRKQGWITVDVFNTALRATKRKDFEPIYQSFDEAEQELKSLRQVVDEKLTGPSALTFKEVREAFEEMRLLLETAVKIKREEEPDELPSTQGAVPGQPKTMAGFWTAGMPTDASGEWQHAEAIIRAGNTDQGLQRMAVLAAQESSGRARFMRKLMLVDVCRNTGRLRLAQSVLEELRDQIIEYKLDRWESSALVGAVWSRLYRIYHHSENSDEKEKAGQLYTQLSKLDPWQAYLDCED